VLVSDSSDALELYYLPEDFSQAKNLAGEHPDKVKQLQELWWKEAERNRLHRRLRAVGRP
jgi:arylsulfatase